MTTSFSTSTSHGTALFDDATNHSGSSSAVVSGGTPAPTSSLAPRVILSPPSINDISDADIIPAISDSTEPEPDPAIIDALKNPKERLFVLKLGESMEALIAERSPTDPLPRRSFSALNPFQRLLIHRCSAYYRLVLETDLVTRNINLTATAISRSPSRRISELVPPENSGPVPSFKIMRRATPDNRSKRASPITPTPVNGSSGTNSPIVLQPPASASAPSLVSVPKESAEEPVEVDQSDEAMDRELAEMLSRLGRNSNGSGGSSTPQRRTLAEREAAYAAARSRIFQESSGDSSLTEIGGVGPSGALSSNSSVVELSGNVAVGDGVASNIGVTGGGIGIQASSSSPAIILGGSKSDGEQEFGESKNGKIGDNGSRKKTSAGSGGGSGGSNTPFSYASIASGQHHERDRESHPPVTFPSLNGPPPTQSSNDSTSSYEDPPSPIDPHPRQLPLQPNPYAASGGPSTYGQQYNPYPMPQMYGHYGPMPPGTMGPPPPPQAQQPQQGMQGGAQMQNAHPHMGYMQSNAGTPPYGYYPPQPPPPQNQMWQGQPPPQQQQQQQQPLQQNQYPPMHQQFPPPPQGYQMTQGQDMSMPPHPHHSQQQQPPPPLPNQMGSYPQSQQMMPQYMMQPPQGHVQPQGQSGNQGYWNPNMMPPPPAPSLQQQQSGPQSYPYPSQHHQQPTYNPQMPPPPGQPPTIRGPQPPQQQYYHPHPHQQIPPPPHAMPPYMPTSVQQPPPGRQLWNPNGPGPTNKPSSGGRGGSGPGGPSGMRRGGGGSNGGSNGGGGMGGRPPAGLLNGAGSSFGPATSSSSSSPGGSRSVSRNSGGGSGGGGRGGMMGPLSAGRGGSGPGSAIGSSGTIPFRSGGTAGSGGGNMGPGGPGSGSGSGPRIGLERSPWSMNGELVGGGLNVGSLVGGGDMRRRSGSTATNVSVSLSTSGRSISNGGGSGSRTPADETASIASSSASSESSSRTMTSTSSKHPSLPPRPEWTVGWVGPGRSNRDSTGSHPRSTSSSSSRNSGHHHRSSTHNHPHSILQSQQTISISYSNDFPPLSPPAGGGDDAGIDMPEVGAGVQQPSVWNLSSMKASLLMSPASTAVNPSPTSSQAHDVPRSLDIGGTASSPSTGSSGSTRLDEPAETERSFVSATSTAGKDAGSGVGGDGVVYSSPKTPTKMVGGDDGPELGNLDAVLSK